MRRLFILVLFGCASRSGSSGSGTAASMPDRVVLIDERGQVYRTTDTRASAAEQVVPATAPQALRALVGVYESLGLSVNTLDWENGRVAARAILAPRRIAGRSIADYIDCGVNHIGQQRASSYAVLLTMESVVRPETAGRMLIATLATATARQQGVSSDPLTCSTTGLLEKQIHLLATERLAGT